MAIKRIFSSKNIEASNIGDINTLRTKDKSNIVNAINSLVLDFQNINSELNKPKPPASRVYPTDSIDEIRFKITYNNHGGVQTMQGFANFIIANGTERLILDNVEPTVSRDTTNHLTIKALTTYNFYTAKNKTIVCDTLNSPNMAKEGSYAIYGDNLNVNDTSGNSISYSPFGALRQIPNLKEVGWNGINVQTQTDGFQPEYMILTYHPQTGEKFETNFISIYPQSRGSGSQDNPNIIVELVKNNTVISKVEIIDNIYEGNKKFFEADNSINVKDVFPCIGFKFENGKWTPFYDRLCKNPKPNEDFVPATTPTVTSKGKLGPAQQITKIVITAPMNGSGTNGYNGFFNMIVSNNHERLKINEEEPVFRSSVQQAGAVFMYTSGVEFNNSAGNKTMVTVITPSNPDIIGNFGLEKDAPYKSQIFGALRQINLEGKKYTDVDKYTVASYSGATSGVEQIVFNFAPQGFGGNLNCNFISIIPFNIRDQLSEDTIKLEVYAMVNGSEQVVGTAELVNNKYEGNKDFWVYQNPTTKMNWYNGIMEMDANMNAQPMSAFPYIGLVYTDEGKWKAVYEPNQKTYRGDLDYEKSGGVVTPTEKAKVTFNVRQESPSTNAVFLGNYDSKFKKFDGAIPEAQVDKGGKYTLPDPNTYIKQDLSFVNSLTYISANEDNKICTPGTLPTDYATYKFSHYVDETGATKNPGDEITVDKDTMLTVIYKPQYTTVKFDANGGSGTIKDIIIPKGYVYYEGMTNGSAENLAKVLPNNTFTPPEGKQKSQSQIAMMPFNKEWIIEPSCVISQTTLSTDASKKANTLFYNQITAKAVWVNDNTVTSNNLVKSLVFEVTPSTDSTQNKNYFGIGGVELWGRPSGLNYAVNPLVFGLININSAGANPIELFIRPHMGDNTIVGTAILNTTGLIYNINSTGTGNSYQIFRHFYMGTSSPRSDITVGNNKINYACTFTLTSSNNLQAPPLPYRIALGVNQIGDSGAASTLDIYKIIFRPCGIVENSGSSVAILVNGTEIYNSKTQGFIIDGTDWSLAKHELVYNSTTKKWDINYIFGSGLD